MSSLWLRFVVMMACLSGFFWPTVSAASLRCDNGIADTGQSTLEVLRKCGEPAGREVIPPVYDAQGHPMKGSANVERWVYGPRNGMYQYLRFVDGNLVQIKSQRQ